MAKNQAVWLKEAKARVVVEDAPLWTPGVGEVLLKNVSASLNPADCAQQVLSSFSPLLFSLSLFPVDKRKGRIFVLYSSLSRNNLLSIFTLFCIFYLQHSTLNFRTWES